MQVIQVGIGGMGNTWLQAVRKSDAVEFAGFVEIDADIARRQAQAHGLDASRIFRTLPEALEAVAADAVINVTPPQVHREICETAFAAGLPVLTEKPLAGSLTDARALAAAAAESGLLCSVAQNYRYRPLSQTVKKLLDSGELGAVGAAQVAFYKGPHFGGFREEMAQPLLIDMAIHHFDMLRFFLDSDAASVSAQSWNPPWSWFGGDASAAAQIRFVNGARASYVGSWCSQAFETSWNADWRFDCAHGVMRVKDDRVYVQRLLRAGGERGSANEHEDWREVPLMSMDRAGQDYLLQEFYEAVTRGGSTGTNAQDNLKTMDLVFGAVAACELGKPVSLIPLD